MKVLLIILGIFIIAFVMVQIFASSAQRNIETYPYDVIKKFESFEIRSYAASLFSTVKLPMEEYKKASRKGFSILAGYIFGGNERNEKISMTSPVAMSLEDSMTMMFMVPKKYKEETLPMPKDTQIEFREVPEKTVAAIRFGGWANDEKILKYKEELKAALDAEGVTYSSKFYFFGYNAPYEVLNRRNEIIVELQSEAFDAWRDN